MLLSFPERVKEFLKNASRNKVRMILVGGGAVNFYGYQRHSADIDFWVDSSGDNFENLLRTLKDMGFSIEQLPEKVKTGEQNISIKISPVFELELITKFDPGRSFEEAYVESQEVDKNGMKYRVLNFDDLIRSKITSERAKDKLDIQELQRIRQNRKKEN
ncbi:hypothetical protein GM418_08985 [Maribellus comscasis]|uniref:DUF6036 domain-containing protein n=1 Tax=Maribellus comscasis TaxID=2681766 RepID=A0A6I6JRU5_9BACT|nr:hypothetical protein GM418_08985 [Maribellus comscasis]